jgi:hypothetical protein
VRHTKNPARWFQRSGRVREASAVRRPRWVSLLVVIGLAVVGGCSSTPKPKTVDLVKDLSILKSQQGFTDKQVSCVATRAQAQLKGKALEQFADGLKVLAQNGTTTGMDPTSLQTFTSAIAACAAG